MHRAISASAGAVPRSGAVGPSEPSTRAGHHPAGDEPTGIPPSRVRFCTASRPVARHAVAAAVPAGEHHRAGLAG